MPQVNLYDSLNLFGKPKEINWSMSFNMCKQTILVAFSECMEFQTDAQNVHSFYSSLVWATKNLHWIANMLIGEQLKPASVSRSDCICLRNKTL